MIAVVQVPADAQPLVDDRELLDLEVQPGVLDRDPGMEREHLDQLLVRLAELRLRPASRSGTGCRPARRRRGPARRAASASAGDAPGSRRCPDACAMSGIRSETPSRMIVPSRPWPCGSGPIAAASRRDIPLVMNRSIRPSAPTIPSAAYWAPTSSRTLSTISCRTRSRSSSPAMARVARSRAGRASSDLTAERLAAASPRRRRDGPPFRAGGHFWRRSAAASIRRMLTASRSQVVPEPPSNCRPSRRPSTPAAATSCAAPSSREAASLRPRLRPAHHRPRSRRGRMPRSRRPAATVRGARRDRRSGDRGPTHDHGAAALLPRRPGADDHDAAALAVVKRFLDGEYGAVEGAGNQPYGDPPLDGDVKVFDMTIDKIKHQIDATKDPIDALGFNGTWPGPRIEVIEGDKRPRHLHEQPRRVDRHPLPRPGSCPNTMDGVPLITQDPIQPGELVHLRVHGQAVRLAHVPLAPQRDRPGRAAACSGAFIVAPEGPGPALRPQVRRDARTSSGSATTRSAASRSTAAASRRPPRSSPSSATRSSSGS